MMLNHAHQDFNVRIIYEDQHIRFGMSFCPSGQSFTQAPDKGFFGISTPLELCRKEKDDLIPTLTSGATKCHLLFPPQKVTYEAREDPLVILWGERADPSRAASEVILEIQQIHDNPVMHTVKKAMHMWLLDKCPWIRRCGRALSASICSFEAELSPHAPPEGKIPDAFYSCPWYVSDAFNHCKDPDMKPRFRFMRDCIICQSDDSVFGLTYVPPHTYYPSHIHKPLEIYHMLSGSGRFLIAGDNDIKEVQEGSLPKSVDICIYTTDDYWVHLPYQAHAMETLEEPALFLWGWVDDLSDIDYSYFADDIFAEYK